MPLSLYFFFAMIANESGSNLLQTWAKGEIAHYRLHFGSWWMLTSLSAVWFIEGLLAEVGRSGAQCQGLKQLQPGFAPSNTISRREAEISYEDKVLREYGLIGIQSKVFVSSQVRFHSCVRNKDENVNNLSIGNGSINNLQVQKIPCSRIQC